MLGTLGVAALLVGSSALAQDGGPTMTLEPGSQNAPLTASEVTVQVMIKNVTNLGAFEFRLKYDPSVLEYKTVRPGGWLASTGRSVSCYTGEVHEDDFIWGCGSTGPMAGPDGSGLGGTVVFSPKAAGTSPITCTKMELTYPNSPDYGIPTVGQCTGVIKITSGSNSDGGNDDDNSNNGSNNNGNNNDDLEPTPTPNIRALTPTAISNAPTQEPRLSLSDPQSQVDDTPPGSQGSSGSGSQSSGSGSSGSSSGSGGRGLIDRVQSAGNFPVAGYGMARDAVSELSLWAQVTLLVGVLTLGLGALVRRRRGGSR
jgi:hypothetical protein